MADARRSPVREALSNHTLDAMLRDGWTPDQVRALIASYRELRDELGYVGEGYVRPDRHKRVHLQHCFNVVERVLREARAYGVRFYDNSVHVGDGEDRDGCGASLQEAFLSFRGNGDG